MRTLFLLGRTRDGVLEIVWRCGWCDTFRTDEDAAKAARGARISHGICAACAARLEAEIDALPLGAA